MKRIVITGIGLITPLGFEVESIWKRLLNGDSAVGMISLFEASNFPTKIAAEVRDWDISEIGEDPKDWERQDRHTRFAIGAAVKAMRDAGLLTGPLREKNIYSGVDPERFGIYTGSGEGKQDFDQFTKMILAGLQYDSKTENFDYGRFIEKGIEILDPVREEEQEPNMVAAHLASLFNVYGPNVNCLTACAASSQAIGEAAEMIKRGETDIMISGGAHSMIHPFGVTGFNLLTALSTNNDDPQGASRPFDKHRDGFVLGEGAGIVVLEELEFALKRGAKIYGELAGYGSTADAFRITDTHPEGRGAIGCMSEAIEKAGLRPEDVDYINAHGTSTSINDRIETLAIKELFGENAYKTPVSSTKSMTGHLIAAGGVTELIYCLLAIRDGMLPPTINLQTPDPECDLDYVANVARKAKCDVAMSNSFGFGGQNVSLVVKRFVG